MARATEITLMIILIEASIVFVGALGVFPGQYVAPVNNSATTFNVQTLNDACGGDCNAGASLISTLEIMAGLAWESLLFGIKLVFTIILVYPELVNTLGVPAILAVFLQAGIYYYYLLFIVQFRSGKGFKFYE